MNDNTSAGIAGVAIVLWIVGVLISLGFTALMLWIGYLITRTAVKNGTILAHEELQRRAVDLERLPLRSRSSEQLASPRLREPDWRADR